jgi:hypothetical protein
MRLTAVAAFRIESIADLSAHTIHRRLQTLILDIESTRDLKVSLSI